MNCVRFFRLTAGLWRWKPTDSCPAGRTGFERMNQRHFCCAAPASKTTLDPSEARKFQSLSRKWWDEEGDFAALHTMNDLRVPFVRDNLLSVHSSHRPGKPLEGLRILDVGCGGGLLTEPLARLGAQVLGIDPVSDSIHTARLHASRDPELSSRVQYLSCTLEELSAGAEVEAEPEEHQFDAIVASEVVEHLADLDVFACCCDSMLKPGGSLFITTISKTNLSYLLGIVVAEQVLRIVPSGTHEWEKFITPTELERLLESNGFSVQSVQGMMFNPLSGSWSWTSSTDINYALHAVRMREEPQMEGPQMEGPQTEGAHS